ncbi:MAG: FliA/WhiG family RNA polymerase sigma factor [Hydrogenibacillus sp.]|nr:FliA/WhiG family RNA polymerase sigma factor [Hydrogenibacillus sp.]MBE3595911.1 FliA/WhiG family RNA polymerase sigma factor [Hydrogenibacillus sp.]
MSRHRTAHEGLEQLWREYKASGARTLENVLVERYAYLVERVVRRMGSRFAAHVEPEELKSFGLVGLMDAVRKYDPARGLKFVTYALWRIRGAIYDGLRAGDSLPRSTREQIKRYEEARSRLEQSTLAHAVDARVAEEAGLSLAQIDELKRRRSAAYGAHGAGSEAEEEDLLESIADPDAPNPEAHGERAELARALAAAIATLPEKERLVLTLFYYEGLSFSEVAGVLELSPSRISQLHTQALKRLRPLLVPWVEGGEYG